MIVCRDCGNTAPSTDGFCTSCGALLEWSGERVEHAASSAEAAIDALEASTSIEPPLRQPEDEAVRPAPVALATETTYDGLFCSVCGARNAATSHFCRSCGRALAVDVRVEQHLPWWRRLFPTGRAHAAGERSRRFKRSQQRHGPSSSAARRRFRLPTNLPLSRVAGILAVLSIAGYGLGAGRAWITTHVGELIGTVKHHVHPTYSPVTPVGARSSSAAAHHPSSLAIDGVKQSAWVSAVGAHGRQWIEVRFAQPVDIDKIGVLSGADGAAYRASARPRALSITADGHARGSVSAKDSADFQTMDVDLHHVHVVRVSITAAYPGQKSAAITIRELQFFAST